MNVLNDISEIVEALNDKLSEEGLEDRFQFSFTTNGHNYTITLTEIDEFGFDIPLFNDDNNFDEDTELLYESEIINFKESVIYQVIGNLNKIASKLTNVCVKMQLGVFKDYIDKT